MICDDGINYENVMQSVHFFDDGDLSARVLRNILNNGGNHNLIIDCYALFADIDSDLTIAISMDLYHHKWQLDNAWRFWLVMVGFGGMLNNGECPVEMCEGFQPDIFKNLRNLIIESNGWKKILKCRFLTKKH
ncbi:MAG: hypothetical protein IKU08_06770 [Clostridia bacterium]|nr:hypothetical protein [Clostridia bacterium]